MILLIFVNKISSNLKMFFFCFCFFIANVALAGKIEAIVDLDLLSGKTEVFSRDTIHKAVRFGDITVVKSLIMQGIDPNLTDNKGWTPLDYAKKRNKVDIEKFLIENGAKTFIKDLPDMDEGPHIRIIDSGNVEILHLKHDSLNHKSVLIQEKHSLSEFPMKVNGYLIDLKDFDFSNKTIPPKSSYLKASKIFVVGDIHGEFDRAYGLLKNNKIIDDKGNWNWGKGHLVFVGDIFDRGSKVTETLWWIFSLEKQAEKSGGKVHLLLGNHEPMIFKKDYRYVTDEYYSLCENLGLDYSELFNKNTVLGYWLRQKPVMIKINQFTFIHAGISPELLEMQLITDSINKFVWQYLNDVENEKNIKTRQYLLGNEGVLWYRGLIQDSTRKGVISHFTLNRLLAFYNSRAFIVGHTEVDSISAFFDKRVVDVNIPKRKKDIREQGLLIKGDKLWVVYDSQMKKKFINYKISCPRFKW